MWLDNYTDRKVYTGFTVTITQVGCQCSHLLWTNPASVATTVSVLGSASTVNVPVPQADSTTNRYITEFDNCYVIAAGCGEDGVFSAGSIVTSGAADVDTLSWVSFTSAGNTASAT